MQFIEKQIFLKKGTKLPQELRIDGSPIKSDWLALSENADVLDQRVRDADGHFFRLTKEVRGWALAMSKESACEAALRRALRRIGASRNGAEVVRVRHRSLIRHALLPSAYRRSAHPTRSDFAFGAFGRPPLSGFHAGEGVRLPGVLRGSGGVRLRVHSREPPISGLPSLFPLN